MTLLQWLRSGKEHRNAWRIVDATVVLILKVPVTLRALLFGPKGGHSVSGPIQYTLLIVLYSVRTGVIAQLRTRHLSFALYSRGITVAFDGIFQRENKVVTGTRLLKSLPFNKTTSVIIARSDQLYINKYDAPLLHSGTLA